MFEIKLNNIKEFEVGKQYYVEEWNDQYDSWERIVADICEVFDISEKVQFFVSGFGQDQWPVDCAYDLLSIIESIPEVIKLFSKGDFNFNLDFYEQGMERDLQFREKEGFIEIKCYSRTAWRPNPEIEIISKNKLVYMVLNIYQDFIQYTEILCEYLLREPLMSQFLIESNFLETIKRMYS